MNVPAAQLYQHSYAFVVLFVFVPLSLVVYFLSRKMTTQDIDLIAGAIQYEEYKNCTWYKDPPTFVKSERSCVPLHTRAKDDALDTTKRGIENVIALMVGDNLSLS